MRLAEYDDHKDSGVTTDPSDPASLAGMTFVADTENDEAVMIQLLACLQARGGSTGGMAASHMEPCQGGSQGVLGASRGQGEARGPGVRGAPREGQGYAGARGIQGPGGQRTLKLIFNMPGLGVATCLT